MGSSKIYLISPYSHKDEKVRKDRYHSAIKAAGGLMNKGYIVFSPIVHCHPIALEFSLPMGRLYWRNHDLAFIRWADAGYVLRIPGWEDSIGVASDIAALVNLGKPVYSSDSGLS